MAILGGLGLVSLLHNTENFYLSLHLLEALFFIKFCNFPDTVAGEKDICPACNQETFIRNNITDNYSCAKCNATYFAANGNMEVKEQTPKWFSYIFRTGSAKAERSKEIYNVKINEENGFKYVNIVKGASVGSNWNTFLPIFQS